MTSRLVGAADTHASRGRGASGELRGPDRICMVRRERPSTCMRTSRDQACMGSPRGSVDSRHARLGRTVTVRLECQAGHGMFVSHV